MLPRNPPIEVQVPPCHLMTSAQQGLLVPAYNAAPPPPPSSKTASAWTGFLTYPAGPAGPQYEPNHLATDVLLLMKIGDSSPPEYSCGPKPSPTSKTARA